MMRRRTCGVTTSRCMPRASTPASLMRMNQILSSGGSHCAWIGRSTAALMARALSARIAAPRSEAGRRASGHHQVFDAVEFDGGFRHFRQLRGRLALEGASGRERLADRAELAGLGAALIADVGLQDGGGEHVAAVQDGDLGIGYAVRRLQVIESRPWRERDGADREAVT